MPTVESLRHRGPLRSRARPLRRRQPVALGGWPVFLGLAAASVCGIAISADRIELVVGALLFALALTAGLLDWRRSIHGLILATPVAGIAVIASYPQTEIAVLAKDLLFVIPAYVGFFGGLIVRRRTPMMRSPLDGIPRAPVLALCVFAGIVLIGVMNPALPQLFLGLIGVKVWLFGMPLILLGYALIESRRDLDHVLMLLCLGAVIPCAIGVVEAVLFYAGQADLWLGLYGDAADAATQGGAPVTSPNGVSIGRIPSTFQFVTQYYVFAAGTVALAYAWMRHTPSPSRRRMAAGVFVLATLAALTSGARGAFLMVPLLLILVLAFDGFRPKLVAAVAGLGSLLLGAAVVITAVSLPDLLDLIARLTSFNLELFGSSIGTAMSLGPFGAGPGVDASAASYAFDQPGQAVVYEAIGGVWLESWWIRALVEVGIFGLLALVAAIGLLLAAGFRSHRAIRSRALRGVSAALLALITWHLIYGVKGQYIDLDPMAQYFWLLAGILLKLGSLRDPAPESA